MLFLGYAKPFALLSALVFVGNSIIWIGVMTESVYGMLLGRLVYGLGGESLNIAISSILSIWFRGKEIAFANVDKNRGLLSNRSPASVLQTLAVY